MHRVPAGQFDLGQPSHPLGMGRANPAGGDDTTGSRMDKRAERTKGVAMLLYLVAIALPALLGTGLAARRSRRRFVENGDAFRCRLRACGCAPTIWPRLFQRWSRRMWAHWTDDVLVVRRGPVFAHLIALRATVSHVGVYSLPADDRRGRVPAIAMALRLRDGAWVDVAAAEDARTAMVGPYLAAAINNLPETPIPRSKT